MSRTTFMKNKTIIRLIKIKNTFRSMNNSFFLHKNNKRRHNDFHLEYLQFVCHANFVFRIGYVV